jgi:hypothetical protein
LIEQKGPGCPGPLLFQPVALDLPPVSSRMRKLIASDAAIKQADALLDAPTRLVCLALGLSIISLALRIASVW